MKKLLPLTAAFLLFSFSLPAQDALIIVNGQKNKTDVKSIDTNTIESVFVLKDKAALDAYGKEGENGVIIINTNNLTDSVMTISEPLHQINLDEIRIIVIDAKVSEKGFDSIAPQEIQSIRVLKGEKAASLYGNKNASSVILVTTNEDSK